MLVRILASTGSHHFHPSEFVIVALFEVTGLVLALLCLCVFMFSSSTPPVGHNRS
jgi:hypothetical protein